MLKPVIDFVWPLVDALYLDVPQPTDGRKPKKIPLNEANFEKKEFQELWGRINHKAVYQVEFDSAELIGKCVACARHAAEGRRHAVRRPGRQAGRRALEAERPRSRRRASRSRTTTRSTETRIGGVTGASTTCSARSRRRPSSPGAPPLRSSAGIKPATFAKFRQNPEQFITEAARLINEQKATVIVEHLTYDTLDDRYDIGDLHREPDRSRTSPRPARSSRSTSTTTSSPTPRSSGTSSTELDTSNEVVVYAKLPRGFFIPTPVGDYNPDWAIAFQEGNGQARLLRRRDQGLAVLAAAQGRRGRQDRVRPQVLRLAQRPGRARAA